MSDEVVGFHAQQAAEKLLKAVLLAKGTRPYRTHDLQSLADAVTAAGNSLPVAEETLVALTPYAVDYRCTTEPPEEPMDRPAACALIVTLREWAEAQVAHAAANRD